MKVSRTWRWFGLTCALAATVYGAFFSRGSPPELSHAINAGTQRAGGAAASTELLALRPRDFIVRPGIEPRQLSSPKRTAVQTVKPAVAPEPQVPQLNVRYVGKRIDGSRWEVFLEHGDDMLAVREGDLLKECYVVARVEPPSMTLRHLATGTELKLEIGAGD
jgi:hypothetical protein